MNNTFGDKFKIELYGASHTKTLGVKIWGVPNNFILDIKNLNIELARRKSYTKNIGTTKRIELDQPSKIEKHDNFILIEFENNNIKDEDYYQFIDIPRPSHSDYVQYNRYKTKESILGGGISSGRMTLPLVAAGFVAKELLKYYGLQTRIITNIVQLGTCKDKEYFIQTLQNAIKTQDSLGVKINCTVIDPPKFVGEPFFDSVESIISHGIFSIPGVKGIEFGDGFECYTKTGKERNDVFISKEGKTLTNNEGGINGGLTNGNKIFFNVAIKPTASIYQEQETYNFKTNQMDSLKIKGRHDICFGLRVPVIIESVTAISLLNLYLCKNYQNRKIDIDQ